MTFNRFGTKFLNGWENMQITNPIGQMGISPCYLGAKEDIRFGPMTLSSAPSGEDQTEPRSHSQSGCNALSVGVLGLTGTFELPPMRRSRKRQRASCKSVRGGLPHQLYS